MDTKGKVVVGVDGSESWGQALRLAARLAPALEAAIHAVAVWELPPVYADETGDVPPDVDVIEAIEAAEAAEAKILAETVAKAFGPDVPRNLSQELIRGPARTNWWKPAPAPRCWWLGGVVTEASWACILGP